MSRLYAAPAATGCLPAFFLRYPNLSAAVAGIAHPPSASIASRFWHDLGYGIGALGLGIAAALGGRIESAFWFVSIAMLLSGLVLYYWGEKPIPGSTQCDATACGHRTRC